MNRVNKGNLKLLEVKLPQNESFRVIKETLTRIGVPTFKKEGGNNLYQSCHILAKEGKTRYYIVHFKEMFALDGKYAELSDEDIQRRNKIATLLESWGFLTIVDKSDFGNLDEVRVKVISHKEKSNWNLIPKYTIGNKGN